MKKTLDCYKLYLIGHSQKNDDYYYLDQEEGQKIIMALAGPNPPKYILLSEGHIINASVIKEIICLESKFPEDYRELTSSEEETNKKFMALRGKKNDFLMLK